MGINMRLFLLIAYTTVQSAYVLAENLKSTSVMFTWVRTKYSLCIRHAWHNRALTYMASLNKLHFEVLFCARKCLYLRQISLGCIPIGPFSIKKRLGDKQATNHWIAWEYPYVICECILIYITRHCVVVLATVICKYTYNWNLKIRNVVSMSFYTSMDNSDSNEPHFYSSMQNDINYEGR